MHVRPSRRLASMVAVAALTLGTGLSVGVLTPASADPIPAGSVSGTILGPGGAPVTNAEVVLYRFDAGSWHDSGWRDVGNAGNYVFAHLPAGTYTAWAHAFGYESRYLGGVENDLNPATVAIGSGATTAPALTLPASEPVIPDENTDLTGVVTDATTGQPVLGMAVQAYDTTSGDYLGSTDTDPTGRYTFDFGGLTPSSVQLYTYDDDYSDGDLAYRSTWFGGKKATATSVALTPGTPATASMVVVRTAGITGRVLNPSGVAPYGAYVEAWNADTDEWYGSTIHDDGTFYLNWLNPGEDYRIRVTDAYDYPGNDDGHESRDYFDVWSGGSNDFTHATSVAAGGPGTWVSGPTFTMNDSLVALDPPSVGGDYVIGQTLTANRGRWNKSGNATFGYEWLRGSSVVGTGTTYALTAADAGSPISLRVTNTVTIDEDEDDVRTASTTTTPQVAKYAASVTAKAKAVKKGKKPAARVTVSVMAGSQAAASVTGTVVVTEGKKKVATVKVAKGTATFTATQPGKHSYALAYSGNGTTLGAHGKATVTVKKAKPAKKGKGKKK